MAEIYVLALGICLATVLAVLIKRTSQPLVVSYILAGAALSLFGLVKAEQLFFLKSIPEIGLAFLLFLVGMELSLEEFRALGRHVFVTVAVQAAVSGFLLTALLARFLPVSVSFLIAISLSFSSTILIVKLLLEKRELVSLHGKLALGISLLEDITAIFILLFLSVGSNSSLGVGALALVFIKGIFLIWLALFSGRRLLPRMFFVTADNGELLFLTSIAWCLLFVSVASVLGLSVSIGAFLAGVSLAQSAYRVQISGRVKPLRDFFVMLFFVNLGAQISFPSALAHFGVSLLLTLYVALVKPVVVFLTLVFSRFRARTAFQVGLLLSSISEFSLIILFSAAAIGVFPAEFVSPVILGVVLSFILSSLLIIHSRAVYHRLAFILKKVERSKTINLDFLPEDRVFSGHAVLVGCHRSGQIILRGLRRLFDTNLIVVDFNPEVIEGLRADYVPCIYGDIADLEIVDKLNLKEAKLLVSTVRDLADNLALLDALEKVQSKAVVIITAADNSEAVKLYERGAHHVSLPLNLEGQSISHLISDHINNLKAFAAERERKLGEAKRVLD